MALPKQAGFLNKSVTEAGTSLKTGTKQFLDKLDAPAKAAAAARTEKISRLQKAAEQVGVSADEVNDAIRTAELTGEWPAEYAGTPLEKMYRKIYGQQKATRGPVGPDTITGDEIAASFGPSAPSPPR